MTVGIKLSSAGLIAAMALSACTTTESGQPALSVPTETLTAVGDAIAQGVGGGSTAGGGTTAGNGTVGQQIASVLIVQMTGELARRLNEEQQQKAAGATSQALEEDIQVEPAPRPAASSTPSSGGQPVKVSKPKNAEKKVWKDEKGDTTGSAEVVEVKDVGTTRECRTVREIAVIKGEDVVQETEYCKKPEGGWEPVEV